MAIEKVRRNGQYAPLSATYYMDDDIAEAGEAAELLFLRGLAFCAGRPSDGFMSDSQVLRFVGIGLDGVAARIERLVQVGLWERVGGGYVIRAWLKWNKSAEELGQYRAQDRDRKRSRSVNDSVRADENSIDDGERAESERNGSRRVNRSPNGGGADSERRLNDRPVDTPNPDTMVVENPSGGRSDSDAHYTSLHNTSLHTLQSASRTGVSDETSTNGRHPRSPTARKRTATNVDNDPDWIAFWDAYPRKVDKGHARKEWLTKVNAGVDPHTIATGAARYRDNPRRPTEPRYIPHPARWINGERWGDEDRPTRTARPKTADGGAWWNN